MKAGVAALAGLLLLACSAPAFATSSSVIIGYYQSFPLTVQPAAGNLCKVGGVPTENGITAPTTGQTTIAFTEGTGVHYMDINATKGYTAYDAVLSPSPALKIDTSKNISLVFNSSAAAVGDVASVTLVLVDGSDNYNCSATITFTVVSAPQCTAPPAPGTIAPYPAGQTAIQNPKVPTTVVQQTINIINVQYNINVQTTTNNYYAFACACCFNSCNNYIVVTPPAAAPVAASPPPAVSSPPPPVQAPSPAPVPVASPPPPVPSTPVPVPAPAPYSAPPPPAGGASASANAGAVAGSA